MKKVQTEYGEADLIFNKYANGRLAISLVSSDIGEPIAGLTVNLPEEALEDGEFFVKTWSENAEIAKDCLASGHFVDTRKRVTTGFVQAQVWKFNERGVNKMPKENFDWTKCPKKKPVQMLNPLTWEKKTLFGSTKESTFEYHGCILHCSGPPMGACTYPMIMTHHQGDPCLRLTPKFFEGGE